jgi:hypothetical protein
MKRLSENGARPVLALGGLNTQPFGRLGALVFQPHNSESLYWTGLSAQLRIAGCAWAKSPMTSAGKTFFSERRSTGCFVYANCVVCNIAISPSWNSVGFAENNRISFSLWTGLADYPSKTPGSGPSPPPGADASAIHGQTERSGCTAAEPYPLSCMSSLTRRKNYD